MPKKPKKKLTPQQVEDKYPQLAGLAGVVSENAKIIVKLKKQKI